MGKLIIIENNQDDWEKIRNAIISAAFEALPNDLTKFSLLSGDIANFFDGETTAKEAISTFILDNNDDTIGFIIDYMLVGNKSSNKDGVAFYTNFLQSINKPVLFCSGSKSQDDWNDMFEKIDKINETNVIAHLFMKGNSNWSKSLTERIKRIFNGAVEPPIKG